MTAEEFERAYAERSNVTVEWLRQYRTVRPCECEYEGCEGWQMVSPEHAAEMDADAEAFREHLLRSLELLKTQPPRRRADG